MKAAIPSYSTLSPCGVVVSGWRADALVQVSHFEGQPDAALETIVRGGYRRVLGEHRVHQRMAQVAGLIRKGMARIEWSAPVRV